jgi:DDE family transposase
MGKITDRGVEGLVPPDGTMREGKRTGWEDGVYQQMRDKFSTEPGNQLNRQRRRTLEPVYGQIKHNRKIDRLMPRGRAAV